MQETRVVSRRLVTGLLVALAVVLIVEAATVLVVAYQLGRQHTAERYQDLMRAEQESRFEQRLNEIDARRDYTNALLQDWRLRAQRLGLDLPMPPPPAPDKEK